MRWWGWVLIGLVLGATIAILTNPDPTEAGQVWLDSLNVERERSLVMARDSVRRAATVDSLMGIIGAIQIDTAAQRRLREANARAAASALLARQALDSARTASDSLRLVFVALGASEAHRDTLEQEVQTLSVNLEATGRMLALTREVTQEISAQRDSARVEAGRWKLRAFEAERIIETKPNPLGRGAETVALGAATYGACSKAVLSPGCVAGGLATLGRVL